MPDEHLRIFTLNCWYVSAQVIVAHKTDLENASRGLKYVSKHRTERITAIANALASSDYDVITLQELWVFSDFEYVRAAVSKRLPYSKFFYR